MPSLEGMGIMTPRVLGMPKDEAWARVSRVPTPRLIDLIFETIDSDCDKLLARREIRFSPFGLKLAKHWKALDLKSERTFSLREWHQFFDELRDELGREFDDFIVELVWHADVDVTHLLPLDFGGTPRPMATSSTASARLEKRCWSRYPVPGNYLSGTPTAPLSPKVSKDKLVLMPSTMSDATKVQLQYALKPSVVWAVYDARDDTLADIALQVQRFRRQFKCIGWAGTRALHELNGDEVSAFWESISGCMEHAGSQVGSKEAQAAATQVDILSASMASAAMKRGHLPALEALAGCTVGVTENSWVVTQDDVKIVENYFFAEKFQKWRKTGKLTRFYELNPAVEPPRLDDSVTVALQELESSEGRFALFELASANKTVTRYTPTLLLADTPSLEERGAGMVEWARLVRSLPQDRPVVALLQLSLPLGGTAHGAGLGPGGAEVESGEEQRVVVDWAPKYSSLESSMTLQHGLQGIYKQLGGAGTAEHTLEVFLEPTGKTSSYEQHAMVFDAMLASLRCSVQAEGKRPAVLQLKLRKRYA